MVTALAIAISFTRFSEKTKTRRSAGDSASSSEMASSREGANKSYGTRAFTGNPLILND